MGARERIKRAAARFQSAAEDLVDALDEAGEGELADAMRAVAGKGQAAADKAADGAAEPKAATAKPADPPAKDKPKAAPAKPAEPPAKDRAADTRKKAEGSGGGNGFMFDEDEPAESGKEE